MYPEQGERRFTICCFRNYRHVALRVNFARDPGAHQRMVVHHKDSN
jgi:hypothetical protein